MAAIVFASATRTMLRARFPAPKRARPIHNPQLTHTRREQTMPRGDKSKYTGKQERKAEHIAEGYAERGVPEKEAKRRAWATVNKIHKGGEKPGGSGYGKPEDRSSNRKGGKRGGAAAA